MTLSNVDLLALQPASLQDDPSTRALCHALQPVFTGLAEQLKGMLIYTHIDQLDGPVLDELAWGMDIGWYRADDTPAARRATVKQALRVFAHMGTVGAVKRAASAAFGDAEVEEWFDYGGEPGCFRVYTEEPAATTTRAQEFIATVEAVKNVRSHLEQVILATSSPAALRMGGVPIITHRIRSVQIDG